MEMRKSTTWSKSRLLAFSILLPAVAGAAPGDTSVARWKEDRRAAFLLMFDDGWPSHWQVAVPELAKRGMIATFYIVPGKGEFKKFEEKWRTEIPPTGMVYGAHTMTHQGVKDLAHAEWEIGESADYLRALTARPDPELLSYARPGVPEGMWNITDAQEAEILKKNRLIDRPPFRDHGAMYHLKTKDEILALADKAIAAKGMEYVIWHGVERIEPDWGYQDMWAMKQEVLLGIFDGLKSRSDRGELWITDHISQHKYETQRNAAAVKILEKPGNGIEVQLACTADPALYDAPLTLVTEVPAAWKKVKVTQGGRSVLVEVEGGRAVYEAAPGAVRLTPEP